MYQKNVFEVNARHRKQNLNKPKQRNLLNVRKRCLQRTSVMNKRHLSLMAINNLFVLKYVIRFSSTNNMLRDELLSSLSILSSAYTFLLE